MDRGRWIAVFVLVTGCLAALPEGGVEARTEQGRLTGFGSWWSPQPGYQGRWWWREAGGGSAWIRAGGFQAGPLVVEPASEGWLGWGPDPSLASGHWGVGLDGGPWGVWAVQDPDELTAGAQARLSLGPGRLAAGTDRTWPLQRPFPETGPWVDRVRLGWNLDCSHVEAGAEGTVVVPAQGPRGWWGRVRAQLAEGLWTAGVEGSGGSDPASPRPPWQASARLGWRPWSAGWSGEAGDPQGAVELGWSSAWTRVTAAWGPQRGWRTQERVEFPLGVVRLRLEAQAAFDGSWTGQAGIGARNLDAPERWRLGWRIAPGEGTAAQTVTAAWTEGALEAEGRWRVEGLRLGWIGPGTQVELTVRWLF